MRKLYWTGWVMAAKGKQSHLWNQRILFSNDGQSSICPKNTGEGEFMVEESKML